MGVKDLWTVLSPVCEKKSLWELEGMSIAIDLSAWICDSNSICSPQINMYLRNLFFRTSYLLLLGVKPVFVLEGDAPELKADAIRKRLQLRAGNTGTVVREGDVNRACSRTRLKGLQKQCVELLSHMGLECVKARGEAEAFCAHLNALGLVSGVVTQDSDVFLYGAKEVYRNFQLAPHYTCDAYSSDVIQEKLGLSRTKLIGFSVLAGSDYNEGVSKIGKATILKYLNSIQDKQVFQKFIEWRNKCYFDGVSEKKFMTSDMRLEFSIREKALKDDGFPYLDVIAEYTADPERSDFEYKWSKPNLARFVAFAVKKLAWEDEYAVKKFLPVLGRWHLSNGGHPCGFAVVSIVGNGQGRNASKYRVAWNQHDIVTAESKELVQQCYPHLVDAFEESRQKKKKKPKGTGRGRKKKTAEEAVPAALVEKQPSLDRHFPCLFEPPENPFEPLLEVEPPVCDIEPPAGKVRSLSDKGSRSRPFEQPFCAINVRRFTTESTPFDVQLDQGHLQGTQHPNHSSRVTFPPLGKGILDDSSFDETMLPASLRSPRTPLKPSKKAKVDKNASIISIEDDDLHDLSLAIESIVSCPQSNPALLL